MTLSLKLWDVIKILELEGLKGNFGKPRDNVERDEMQF